jgi:hypothetical protein
MRRVIRKRIRQTGNGIDLVADVNAVIAINDGREQGEEPEGERPGDEPGDAEVDQTGRTAP